MVSLFLVAIVGALQLPFHVSAYNWSIAEAVQNGAGKLLDYMLPTETISFSKESDIGQNVENMKTIELYPGQSITYACGKPPVPHDGVFSLVPKDPVYHVLDFKGDNTMDVALKRIKPSFSVYRSDKTIFSAVFMNMGFDHYLITYPKNSIIVARDPEKFSINLVCMYRSNRINGPTRYNWLQIKFNGVVTMPFGCGSAMPHMFRNAIPLIKGDVLQSPTQRKHCSINARPGMVVGIYCDKGETVYPADCFGHVEGLISKTVTSTQLLGTNFPHNSNSGRLRLAIADPNNLGHSSGSVCYCKDKGGKTTASVKVLIKHEQTCNYSIFLSKYALRQVYPTYNCHKELSNGRLVRLVLPKTDYTVDKSKKVNGIGIFPEDPRKVFLLNPDDDNTFISAHVSDFFATEGLSVARREEGTYIIYEFVASPRAIIILKRHMANLSYIYRYYDTFSSEPYMRTSVISLGIIPTDPYTHGCGTISPKFFDQTHSKITETPVKIGNDNFKQYSCTVNGYKSSPVGFYCPEDYILYPKDCFNEMIQASTGQTVLVNDFAPFARKVESKNFLVLDFSIPDHKRREIKYSHEVLQCFCKRMDGTIMASISLDLSMPED